MLPGVFKDMGRIGARGVPCNDNDLWDGRLFRWGRVSCRLGTRRLPKIWGKWLQERPCITELTSGRQWTYDLNQLLRRGSRDIWKLDIEVRYGGGSPGGGDSSGTMRRNVE